MAGNGFARYFPSCIAPDVDAKIRDRFPIALARSAMLAGNDRW